MSVPFKVICPAVTLAEIFLDGAGKEPGSLGDIGNGASQFRLGKTADVGSL